MPPNLSSRSSKSDHLFATYSTPGTHYPFTCAQLQWSLKGRQSELISDRYKNLHLVSNKASQTRSQLNKPF